ncbi:MAG: NAD(P)/FAD-dependent oxidoreductase [Candidatus Acidiferrales bacterium]
MSGIKNWGRRPWTVEFRATPRAMPAAVDFAVVGGGFTGLAAAAWLKRLASEKSVALFEAGKFGAGSSGYTGGVALAESAAGELPGLGDVLVGYQKILRELEVDGEVLLPGAYELGRSAPLANTPIRWKDSGDLCVVKEVPGGTINPGKVVSGLARAAERAGVMLFEDCAVEDAIFAGQADLRTNSGEVRAGKVLFATNAFALEMTGLQERAGAAFTLAVATQPLTDEQLREIGLAERKPFYTVDLPYLWGRLLAGNQVIFGSGLVFLQDWRELATLDIECGEAAELFELLEKRVHGLHPALNEVEITHRWGGPICMTWEWKPVFEQHPSSENAIVLGAYSGHGVAQSVYLGCWAAEALLGIRMLPNWK